MRPIAFYIYGGNVWGEAPTFVPQFSPESCKEQMLLHFIHTINKPWGKALLIAVVYVKRCWKLLTKQKSRAVALKFGHLLESSEGALKESQGLSITLDQLSWNLWGEGIQSSTVSSTSLVGFQLKTEKQRVRTIAKSKPEVSLTHVKPMISIFKKIHLVLIIEFLKCMDYRLRAACLLKWKTLGTGVSWCIREWTKSCHWLNFFSCSLAAHLLKLKWYRDD